MRRKYLLWAAAASFVMGIVLISLPFMAERRGNGSAGKGRAAAMAEKILLENSAASRMPKPRMKAADSYDKIYSSGSIMIVKEPSFAEVEPPPKSPMQRLNELAARKNRIPPVEMSENDLKKKISIPKKNNLRLKPYEMPPINAEKKEFPLKMLKAWVDYKVFSDRRTWDGFLKSHKAGKIDPDFSRENVIILVSLSSMPSGIFKIVSVKEENGKYVVSYKVNHLVMAESYEGEREIYSAAAIGKKDLPVELRQLP